MISNGRVGLPAGELKTAWERVTLLQKKYADMQATHAALKGQHTRAVQQVLR